MMSKGKLGLVRVYDNGYVYEAVYVSEEKLLYI